MTATIDGLDIMRAFQRGELPPPGAGVLVGLTLEEVERGRVVFGLDVDERHHNPMGTIHGGILAVIADSAMGCAVQTVLPANARYTTVDLSMHYVKAARDGFIVADGRVVHHGGRVATAEVRVTDADGVLLAHGTSTCIVIRPDRNAS
jgi:uncharacterized protein (TIGR00369 family)